MDAQFFAFDRDKAMRRKIRNKSKTTKFLANFPFEDFAVAFLARFTSWWH